MTRSGFICWDSYAGKLYETPDDPHPSAVYGIETYTAGHADEPLVVPDGGAVFGYVAAGRAEVISPAAEWRLSIGQWFTCPWGCAVWAGPSTCVLAVQRTGFRGVSSAGGPIEERGRLKYIDGCSDTLLACPPLLGDPCFNHLHFPPGIEQTEHTHPSLRAGIIARGLGECETPTGKFPLRPGRLFVIPTDGPHRFLTRGKSMDVIAYHPDSDWGPTHEDHPMVNRTLVGGKKIDNTAGVHAGAVVVEGQLG